MLWIYFRIFHHTYHNSICSKWSAVITLFPVLVTRLPVHYDAHNSKSIELGLSLWSEGRQQSVPPNGLLITRNYFAIVEGTSSFHPLREHTHSGWKRGRGQGRGAVPLQPCAKKSQFNLISAYFFRCYSIEFDCPADAGTEYQKKKNTKEKKSKWRKALKTWVFTWVFIWKALKLSWLIHQ